MTDQQVLEADDRLVVRESPAERRVAELAAPVLAELGYRLVRVRVSGRDGGTVQIMAERPDGTMTIDDCTEASRVLSPVFDVEEPVSGGYNLELSSPGIDRPLVRLDDFERACGKEVKLELKAARDGRRRFRGILEAADGETLTLRLDEGPGGEQTVTLPMSEIGEAKLVMSERLLEEALRESKARR